MFGYQRVAKAALLGVVLGSLLVPAAPAAAVWPCGAGGVSLAFGAEYAAPDGRVVTHRGVDVATEAGEGVAAPAGGVVAFAGRVPGPHGGTVGAVSIDLADGRRLTLLPLTMLSVAAGDRVGEGDVVGDVAASGDPSSAGPHVHVGLRAGDVYLDPLALLGSPPAGEGAEAPEPAEAPAPEPLAPGASVAGAPAAAGAASVAGGSPAAVSLPAAAAQLQPAPGASAGVHATSADRAPLFESGPVPSAVPAAPRLRVPSARAQSPADTLAALRSAAAAAAVPLVSLAAAIGLLAMRRRDDVSEESSMPVGAVVGCEVATAQVR